MARKKQIHYATSNGTPLAFDKNLGVLLPSDRPTEFPGYRGLRQMNRIINKTMMIRSIFETSILFDWGKLASLKRVGVIKSHVLP